MAVKVLLSARSRKSHCPNYLAGRSRLKQHSEYQRERKVCVYKDIEILL